MAKHIAMLKKSRTRHALGRSIKAHGNGEIEKAAKRECHANSGHTRKAKG